MESTRRTRFITAKTFCYALSRRISSYLSSYLFQGEVLYQGSRMDINATSVFLRQRVGFGAVLGLIYSEYYLIMTLLAFKRMNSIKYSDKIINYNLIVLRHTAIIHIPRLTSYLYYLTLPNTNRS